MTLIINISTKPVPPVKVSVVPKDACMKESSTLQLAAVVENATNTEVIWLPISGPGSVNQSGVYTSPSSGAPTTAVIRAIAKADPYKYDDSTISIVPASGSCCDPLINIVPNAVVLGAGDSQQFLLYLNGVYTDPSTVPEITWSVVAGSGTVTPSGLYTAPTTTQIQLTEHTVRAASGLECYDDSYIIINENALSVEVTPKYQTVYPGEDADFAAEVFGIDNQTVLWSLQEMQSGTSSGYVYTPTGYTTDDVTVTAPGTLPDYPYIKVRATSIVNSNIYDEATLRVVDATLPVTPYKFTKYYRREPVLTFNAGNFDVSMVSEYVYQEADPFYGTYPELEEYTRTYSSYGLTSSAHSTQVLPCVKYPQNLLDGTTISTFIPVVAHDNVAVPSDPSTDYIWSRTYKIPIWERVLVPIEKEETPDEMGFTWLTHDFEGIGSTLVMVTGGTVISGDISYEFDDCQPVNRLYPTETTFLKDPVFENKSGFVYYTSDGFFSGALGNNFQPAADAIDAVQLWARYGSTTFTKTLYFRPEPDLPEVFPELVNPQLSGAKAYYLPMEYPNTVTTDSRGEPISYTISSANYLTAEEYASALGCTIECGEQWSGSGAEYPSLNFIKLPFTTQNIPTDGTLPPSLVYDPNCMMPPTLTYFGHYYHGMWFAAIPAVFAPRDQYAVSTSYVPSKPKVSGTGALNIHNKAVTKGDNVSTVEHIISNTSDDGIPGYEVKLSAIKNRHFMSYLPDLTPREFYPADVKFEVLGMTDPARVDSRVTDPDRYSNLTTADCELSVTQGKYSVVKPKLNHFTGPAKMCYIKITPQLFGGTYNKYVIVPVFLLGVVASTETNSISEDGCNTYTSYTHTGYHLHQNNFTFDMWFSDKTPLFRDYFACHDNTDPVTNYCQSTVMSAEPHPIDRFVRLQRYLAGGLTPYQRFCSPIPAVAEDSGTTFGVSRAFFINLWAGYSGGKTGSTTRSGNTSSFTTVRSTGSIMPPRTTTFKN